MTSTRCYIDFASGDQARYDDELSQYSALKNWLAQNGAKYGLARELSELDETARETLTAVYGSEAKVSTLVELENGLPTDD